MIKSLVLLSLATISGAYVSNGSPITVGFFEFSPTGYFYIQNLGELTQPARASAVSQIGLEANRAILVSSTWPLP